VSYVPSVAIPLVRRFITPLIELSVTPSFLLNACFPFPPPFTGLVDISVITSDPSVCYRLYLSPRSRLCYSRVRPPCIGGLIKVSALISQALRSISLSDSKSLNRQISWFPHISTAPFNQPGGTLNPFFRSNFGTTPLESPPFPCPPPPGVSPFFLTISWGQNHPSGVRPPKRS